MMVIYDECAQLDINYKRAMASARPFCASQALGCASCGVVIPSLGPNHESADFLLSPGDALQKLHEQHPYLPRITDWSNVVLAGGSVARSLFPRGYDGEDGRTDADFWIYGLSEPQDVNHVLRNLIVQLRPDWVLVNKAIVYMSIPLTAREKWLSNLPDHVTSKLCQVVLLEAHEPVDVLDAFDLAECCVTYDGRNIQLSTRAVGAFANRWSVAFLDCVSGNPIARFTKYADIANHHICYSTETPIETEKPSRLKLIVQECIEALSKATTPELAYHAIMTLGAWASIADADPEHAAKFTWDMGQEGTPFRVASESAIVKYRTSPFTYTLIQARREFVKSVLGVYSKRMLFGKTRWY